MKSQTATSGKCDPQNQTTPAAKKPADCPDDASEKVVEPFAQQTQRPQ